MMGKHKNTASEIVLTKYLPILGKLLSADCTVVKEILCMDDITLGGGRK